MAETGGRTGPELQGRPAGSEQVLVDGRYRLEGLLGRGGMASVYRAFDTRLERAVAVKLLGGARGADERRFRAEVRTLARLSHPHLVRVLDAGDLDGRPYLVMDLVEGTNLATRLTDGPLPPGEVAAIGSGVAAALACVHDHGVVHRDVKPANILLDAHGTPYLADFGIARLVDTGGLTATGQLVGTPAYLAPEQLHARAVGAPADVYALGLVLLECLTGTRPFGGSLAEIAAAKLVRGPAIPEDLDPSWRALLSAMTAREPSDRPPASAVAEQLGRFGVRSTGGPSSSAAPRRPPVAAAIPDQAGGPRTVAIRTAAVRTEVLPTRDPRRDPHANGRPGAGAHGPGTDPAAAVVAEARSRQARRSTATRRSRHVRAALATGTLVGALLLGLVLGELLFGGQRTAARRSDPAHALAQGAPTHTGSVEPSVTTTPTTSTTIPPYAAAAGDLVTTLVDGEQQGEVSAQAAQQLLGQLQALLASPAGPPGSRIHMLHDLFRSFTRAVSSGAISGSRIVASLTNELDALAAAIGEGAGAQGPGPGPGQQGNGED